MYDITHLLQKRVHKPLRTAKDICVLLEAPAASFCTGNLLSVLSSASLADAAHALAAAQACVVLVLDKNAPIGFLSQNSITRDVLLRHTDPRKIAAREADLDPVVTLDVSATVLDAYLLLSRTHGQAVLLTKKGKPYCIFGFTELRKIFSVFSHLPLQYTPLVRSYMNKNVLYVGLHEGISGIKKKMQGSKTDFAIVLDRKRPVGMITPGTLADEIALNHFILRKLTAQGLMFRPVVSVGPAIGIFEANAVMLQHHVRYIAVAEGNLVAGFLNEQDVAHSMFSYLMNMKCLIHPTKETAHD